MEREFEVRRLGAADAAVYREIRLETLRAAPDAFGSTVAEEETRADSDHVATLAGSTVLGAWAGREVVGTIRLSPGSREKDRHKGEIGGLFVRPGWRGRGVGDALMSGALAAAREAGLEHVTLTAVAANAPAVRLYERFGFERYGLELRARKWEGRYQDIASMIKVLG